MPFTLDLLSGLLDGLHEVMPQEPYDHIAYLGVFSCCVFSLATWRLLKFTVIPSFYPYDPKELPYWIPVLDNGPSHRILRGLERAVDRGQVRDDTTHQSRRNTDMRNTIRRYFGNTTEPYALTIAGTKTYVITKPEHVGETYRNTETLSYEEFVQAMMRILGHSESSIDAMFAPLPKDKEGFPNPHGKSLGVLARQMHIHQLFPGDNLTFLERRFYDFFDANLRLDRLHETCAYAVSKTPGDVVLPLTRWCSDYFVKSGQNAYFGPRLADIDPCLTDAFVVFDELSYQVIYQYPRFLAREMLASQDRVLKGLKQYLQLPFEERSEDAWFVKAMETEMRAVGMDDEDLATATMTIYWAINTNTRKSCYWMLAHLVREPSLIDIVRRETGPAFRSDGTVDFSHLHKAVPHLDAMWNEMLRLSAFAASVRMVTGNTVVGGKVLRKGARLIIPYRQLHMNAAVYGEPVDQFRHERFLEKPRLAQSSSFRPFGGGHTMCPGRYIAKRAVYLYVAMVLRRFEVELVGEKTTLEPDLTKPVPGLMSPKVGEELHVRLSPRKDTA